MNTAERTAAKGSNFFGQLYALSPSGLMRQVDGLTFEQARDYLRGVSTGYPQLDRYLNEQVRLAQVGPGCAKSRRYIPNLYGR